jgi:hypothetical protein
VNKILNLEILKNPVSVMVIIVIIALWYFGAFAIFKSAKPATTQETVTNGE